jgi:outer membrane lipopolysaccharide assembly protein LptE/RlpB
MASINLTLPDRTHQELRREAKRSKQSMAAIVDQATRQELALRAAVRRQLRRDQQKAVPR